MTAPLIDIIIPNWNGLSHLQACLLSLSQQTFSDFGIIVVDNASEDGSVLFIEQNFPEVTVIQLEKNEGFALANNIGINQSQAKYIATLNNDTRVEADWLAKLVTAIEAEQGGMCASKMLFWDYPEIINSAGIQIDRAGIAWDRLGGVQLQEEAAFSTLNIFGPSAGAALYRRDMLDEIGLFDADFFAYMEDVDLAWRARLAGWNCVYVPEAVVYHKYSATSGKGSPFKNKLLGRNKWWTILKNYHMPDLLFNLPAILVFDVGSVFVALLRGDSSPLIGRLQAIQGIRPILAKRKTIQAMRKRSAKEMRQLMQPVESPKKVLARYAYLEEL